jgi:PAS domain S-box-containing protein
MKKNKKASTTEDQIRELQERLYEAEANLEAIRSGQADAIVIHTEEGSSVFTIQGADVAYRIMVETMNEGALTLDPQGVILYVNNRFAEMLFIPPSLLTGKLLQTFVVEHQVQEFDLFIKRTTGGAKVHKDFELIRGDKSEVPVYFASAPLEIIGRHDICIVAGDLTERVNARQKLLHLNDSLEMKVKNRTRDLEQQKIELEKSQEQLRQLTYSLEEQVAHRTRQVRELAKALSIAEQKQRQRFSTILHEDLQQVLFSVKARFDLLWESIATGTREDIDDDMNDIEILVRKALTTSKRLAIEFNPPTLKGEGLDAALGWLAHHIKNQYGLNVEIDIPENFTIVHDDERVLLVQLVQELLMNVVKHAGTGSANVAVKRNENHIFLEISDKGVGFDIEKEKSIEHEKIHLGLFSIKERLRLFGGDLTVESKPGKGTRITMKLPFDQGISQIGVE